MQKFRACHHSEIGPIEIVGNQKGILAVTFGADEFEIDRNLPAIMTECLRQMTEYFKGRRQKFSVPLIMEGTNFQKAVWRQLQKIPFGRTASYGDVARAVGSPRAFRAVGNANNKNPISLIIPCHRVIGSDGKLVGFGGGIWRKEWLLEHEKRFQ
ncbi:MAG: methylated-DNA--[protein]-cysteine S-methyltransferase [Desulfobacteraceae bacterium]|jgi:methylated-DNA-[protein]-cysteine S-methyltransferase